jgi:hypothetical protein
MPPLSARLVALLLLACSAASAGEERAGASGFAADPSWLVAVAARPTVPDAGWAPLHAAASDGDVDALQAALQARGPRTRAVRRYAAAAPAPSRARSLPSAVPRRRHDPSTRHRGSSAAHTPRARALAPCGNRLTRLRPQSGRRCQRRHLFRSYGAPFGCRRRARARSGAAAAARR